MSKDRLAKGWPTIGQWLAKGWPRAGQGLGQGLAEGPRAAAAAVAQPEIFKFLLMEFNGFFYSLLLPFFFLPTESHFKLITFSFISNIEL